MILIGMGGTVWLSGFLSMDIVRIVLCALIDWRGRGVLVLMTKIFGGFNYE